jgi:leader peptidase (prepilin peptidase)/N-methyltransferase
LSWQDLIPVFSFLILKGKCRYCHKPISLQYPLVELATGILFVSLLNLTQVRPVYFYLLLMTCFLIIIFVYDLKHYLIPDKVIYPAIGIALIFNFQFLISNQFSIFKYSILSAFGAAAFFLTIVLISHEKWMGWGDVKLAFLIGLFLGWPNILVALFLAFFIGAIIGIGLIIAGKKTLKSEIPFGPFLISGTFLAMFFGPKILDWYLSLFLLK